MEAAALLGVDIRADLGPLDRDFATAEGKAKAFDREASKALRGVDSSAKEAGRSIKGLARETAAANDNMRVMGTASRVAAAGVRSLVVSMTTLGAAALAAFSITPVFRFKDAIAEVSTLVDTATFDMERLEKSAIKMAAQFGGGATAQVQAFNDVISAGTEDLARATDIVETANKLAIGGAAAVGTATDGLTTILNAYGDKVENATAVSDALFIAVRDGKSTIDEMASSLGKVAPIAAQTNVSFDELTAAIAALTLGGLSTSESVTGVRAMLAAIAKPTSQATKLAAQLGIEFNTTGLKAKGLVGFLDDLMQKTGGSTDALAVLFGGVEALVPAMALAGSAGDSFANTMDHMAGKAGATEEAFNKMAASPGFQAGRVWSALEAEVLKSGSALGDIMVPALRATADHMDDVFKVAKVAGAALLVAFAPALLSAMATGFVALGTAGVTAIRSILIAIEANPLGAIAVGIAAAIVAAYQFRDDIEQVFGVDVVEEAKNAANRIIGFFVGAYQSVVATWQQLPTVFSAIGKMAWNSLLSEFEKPALTYKGITILPGLDMSALKSDLTEVEKAALDGAAAIMKDAMSVDYIGKVTDKFAESSGSAAESIKNITDNTKAAVPALGGLGDAAAKAAKKAADEFEKFEKTADSLVDKFFPEQAAAAKAEELIRLLDKYGDKLSEIQQQAVEMEIDKLFDKAAGSTEKLEEALKPVGEMLSGLFDGGIKSFDDFLDHVTQGIAQLAQNDISNLFSNLTNPADNDNKPGGGKDDVKDAVRDGTFEGSLAGTFTALFQLAGMSKTGAQTVGGGLGAGVGGFALGYQSQSPLMGAAGGALSGAMALGSVFPGVGHVIGALIGAGSGPCAGKFGPSKREIHNDGDQRLLAA